MVAAERVRGARDLDDDHLHQVRLVAVRVDDEAGDQVELVACGDLLLAIDLGDRVEHDLPALGEERVEDLFLRPEVVVDEAVRDARLVGHVGDAAGVEATRREDADRCVEDLAALVGGRGGARAGCAHRTAASSGQTYAAPWRLARLGSLSRTSACRVKSKSALQYPGPSS